MFQMFPRSSKCSRTVQYAPGPGFDANKDAVIKVYHYLLATDRPPHPREATPRWWVADIWRDKERRMPASSDELKLDVAAMNELAALLEGVRCFRALTEKKKSAGNNPYGSKKWKERPPITTVTSGRDLSDIIVTNGSDQSDRADIIVTSGSDQSDAADRIVTVGSDQSDDRRANYPARGKREKNDVRNLRRLRVIDEGHDGHVRIEMEADGFLYKMCRKLVALLVECGAGRLSVAQCVELVGRADYKRTPRAAPAHGLTLMRAVYRDNSDHHTSDNHTGDNHTGDADGSDDSNHNNSNTHSDKNH
mmetsp:Transcript_44436/g.74118  ORF Transcript_44436/g.74118 Transcript_44436/m.74118 type:complete len:306 (-) Transcript_44436:144-1061(-)